MYLSNLVTQPGETDDYTVSDHLKTLNNRLAPRHVDVVLANNADIDKKIVEKYSLLEHKSLVTLDKEKISEYGARLIEEKIVAVENGTIRHNAMKTAYLIFSYLMEGE